ncbi:extracellular calcium-sensing receptor-like [Latimeria chalumnae]|uniref:extracellular calcium-sensing receptor-like n=1 Tax=Latimeria chalumnae TaxID=7897 RepID=UPI00313EB608
MIFAIDEINQNPNLLPNITLGFEIYDSCNMIAKALEGSLWMVTGQEKPVPNYHCNVRSPLAAIIGVTGSRLSIPMATLLGVYKYPQTVPNDNFQSYGLVRLLMYFAWTWVGILAANDEYGLVGSQIIVEEMAKVGACVAFYETIPLHYSKEKIQHTIDVIKKSTVNVIIVFSGDDKWSPVITEIARQNITGKVWIASDGWATSPVVFTKENSKTLREFWERAFDCNWPNQTTAGISSRKEKKLCTGKEKLEDLLHYMKNVHFKNNAGDEVYFDANGDPPAVYDIVSWQLTPYSTLKYIKVGNIKFDAPKERDIKINQRAIEWNEGQTKVPRSVCSETCPLGYRKAAREGEPICCFDCIHCSEGEITNHTDDHWSNEARDECIPKSIDFLSYEDPMGATLTSISIFATLITAATLYIFNKYQDTPIVKANNRELSYLLLLALMLCFLCSLIFIGYPTRVTCLLRQVAFGIVFTLSVSCVLAKTFMVIIAFSATNPNSDLRKWIGPKLPIAIVCVGTLLQVVICIVWLSSSPPFPEQDMKSQVGKIIIECNAGSDIAFWCMLGYMGLLALVCFTVAFFARKLPGSFNDAQFITFSMLVFVTVWLAFIPAYLSTKGKYMVVVEIFAILASSAGLLVCIFFPKCYIILLRPDMNTKEYLMGKNAFGMKIKVK